MTILSATRPIVKTTILFAPEFTRRMANPAFGVGIARPDREKQVGYTAPDAQWWAENSPSKLHGYEVVGQADCVLDAMARESAELDRVCRGPVL